MGNAGNNDTSEIVQTYAFKVGLAQGRYSYAAAIDLVQSVISVILIFTSNYIAKRSVRNQLVLIPSGGIHHERSLEDRIFDGVNYLLLSLIFFATAYPFYYLLDHIL